MRLIDADDAIERLGAYLMADAQIEWGGTASEDIEDWKELASDILKGSPTIEIIRCRECKYYEAKEDWCYWRDEAITADDFCSYGERNCSGKPNNSNFKKETEI